jgi:membrane protein
MLPNLFRATGRLLVDSANAWVDDRAPRMGAALAYYTLFSIAPLLLIVVSVAGLVFGEQAARGEVFEQLRDLVGNDSAHAIEAMLESVNRPGQGLFSTLIGVVVMLIGATTVLAELQAAMDRIWRVPAASQSGGLGSWLRVRLLAIGLVLGIGFLLMVSLAVSAALSGLSKWAAPYFGYDVLLVASLLNLFISYAFVITLFAMIYKMLPRLRIAWRDVWFGAAITAVLFTVGKWLIGVYIGRAGVASTFGAAASLVVLMLWVYFSAQIFLFGAEITSIYAHRHGSLRPRAGAPGEPNLETDPPQAAASDPRPAAPAAPAGHDNPSGVTEGAPPMPPPPRPHDPR